jgi:short-subunit dehydrogenase
MTQATGFFKEKTMQVIAITGASSGIGQALALAYSSPECTLYLLGRSVERLADTALKCKEKGAKVLYAAIDVRDKQAMHDWLLARDQEDPITMLIANAGISSGSSGLGESVEQMRTLFDVNLLGVLNTLEPILPRMQERSAGHIVLMGSLAGYKGLPSAPAYSASKAAILALGEALHGVLKANAIAVTVVTPGYIRTPLTAVNRFYMPGLINSDEAARYIVTHLSKKPVRLAFPRWFYWVVWLVMCLPSCLTVRLLSYLPKKQSSCDMSASNE